VCSLLRAVFGVALLAKGEGHVAVLDHVLNLVAHGQEEEHAPIHEQNRPEDWHIEDLEPAAKEADDDGACGPVPELELGEATDEGSELFILPGGKGADGAILHFIIGGIAGGVELGRQEGEEQV
jgi:hypothetical protein